MTNNQTKCSIIYEKIAMRAGDDERMINYERPDQKMHTHLLQQHILLQLVIQLNILLFCFTQVVLTDEYLKTNIRINIGKKYSLRVFCSCWKTAFSGKLLYGSYGYLEQAFQLKTLQLDSYHFQVINATTGAYSEPCQTYKMMCFAKMVNGRP